MNRGLKSCSSLLTSSLKTKLLVFARLCLAFCSWFRSLCVWRLSWLFGSLTFKPCSFMFTSSLKTKLLVFLAYFSSPATLLGMSAKLQSSLALVFCITVKSCCLFVCLIFWFFFPPALLLKTALSRDSCTFSLISVIAVHFRKQIAKEVDSTRNKVQFYILAFCIIHTRMRASESPPGTPNAKEKSRSRPA